MVNTYTKEDYAKSYTELIEILKYVSNEDLKKIPKTKLETYMKNRDCNYNYIYNKELSFENQNILKLTKILIANIYIQYWASNEEREEIRNQDKKELYKIEMKKKEIYSTDNLFNKKTKTEVNCNQETSMIVIKKKNIIEKIIDKIKKKFKLT